jgi:predicted ATP-grasp superfamily ATP-dependent carboligase
VFARRNVVVGNTERWVENRRFADVPSLGEHIRSGRPICTVFRNSPDPATCLRELARQAAHVYRRIGLRTRQAA